MKLSSLDDLSGIKKKFPKKRFEKASKALETPEQDRPNCTGSLVGDDDFARAMTGVHPLGGRQKGREVHVAPCPEVKSNQTGQDPGGEGNWVMEYLRNLVQGNVEFELSYSEEYMHGYIQDLDRRVLQKLKAGQFSVEAHLDMHGLNALQARDAALDFLRDQYNLGRRCLLLIPGRGRNSPGGQALIREELPVWLTRDPLRRIVLAFCTALPRHGGAGALYVLLRKCKKNMGKVRWDLPASME
ncbi:MAG TPA: DNA mismatch repair protein MutS [Desulfonatronum sp.]|nr:DNA mismatch repair protein MutS [Desulfonatronum sp.]